MTFLSLKKNMQIKSWRDLNAKHQDNPNTNSHMFKFEQAKFEQQRKSNIG